MHLLKNLLSISFFICLGGLAFHFSTPPPQLQSNRVIKVPVSLNTLEASQTPYNLSEAENSSLVSLSPKSSTLTSPSLNRTAQTTHNL